MGNNILWVGLLAGSVFLFAAQSVAEELPAISEIESAIASISSGNKSKKIEVKILGVEGCYPTGQKDNFICLVRALSGGNTSVEELPMQNVRGKWSLLKPNETRLSPRCPGNTEATKLLRTLKGRSDIEVTGETDDGEGSFSDERGMTRSEKGPLRLMCRFNVNDSLGTDRLYICYLSYTDGKYRIDPDVEVWD